MYEIQAGNLAADKGSKSDVKDFGKQMVKDHTESTRKLKETKSAMNAKIPTELDAEHAQKLDKLRKLSGAEFDREYLMQQTEAHDKAATLLRGYSQSGTDAELKKFASEVLPVVEQHRTHLTKLNGGTAKNAAR